MTVQLDRSNPDVLKVRFSIDGESPAGPVSVVGSFNQWLPGLDELVADEDGSRSATVGVPYGEELVFRYLANGNVWFDEPDADVITSHGSVLHAVAPATVVDLTDREADQQQTASRTAPSTTKPG